MGGIDFRTRSRGKSVRDAYTSARSEAEFEHGNDPYNGTISTTQGYKDVTDEYRKSGKTIEDFMEAKLENCPKWQCYAICTKEPVENELKVKSQVENLATPGTKKWLLVYEVRAYRDQYVGKAEDKATAIKIAREYTEKHQTDTHIIITRKLEKGSDVVARIHYKKSKKESNGEWIFFGVAGC